MNAKRYARIKTIFMAAIKRPDSEREAFLIEACGDDAELRSEVDSLLAHHFNETILEDTHTGHTTTKDVLSGKGFSDGDSKRLTWPNFTIPQDRPTRRLIALACMAVFLALVGWWTYNSIHHALNTVRGESLKALLDADVLALELWIESRKAEAKACVEDPELREAVGSLVEIARQGTTSPEALKSADERLRLHELIDPYVDEQNSAGYFVVDRAGLILGSTNEDVIGARLNAQGMAAMTPVFDGEIVYSRPYPPGSLLNTTHALETDRPMCWVDAPVPDKEGDYIASLGFATFADENFSDILEVGDIGETGETYAFDAQGLMLSESRFDEQLRELGLIDKDESSRSMVNVQVRDPGVDLTRGGKPSREVAARPLTEIAALAIASRDKTDPAEQQGLLLDGYRDYRGVEVIGAWRWLPQYHMGVVTEMDVREAYLPLRYLLVSYGVLFGLLAISATAAVISMFSAAGWRRRVQVAEELGPYRLGKKIGEGGMGTVYFAQHAMLKRAAAIKLMKPDQVGHEGVKRFEREVQIASRLSHPNTIEIYDFGSTKSGSFYCAMEYVEGVTLHELVTCFGPVTPERAVFILCQVCGSLAEAHAQSLIHRDIKPQNIMLCQRGGQYDFVKVLDFGLAKDLSPASANDVTKTMQIGGTPLYMAPERFIDPQHVDHRSDIYAIGAVAFYIVSGQSHKEATSESALSDAGVPGELEEIIMACLQRDPGDRPQTVVELSRQLRGVALPAEWSFPEAQAWWEYNLPEVPV